MKNIIQLLFILAFSTSCYAEFNGLEPYQIKEQNQLRKLIQNKTPDIHKISDEITIRTYKLEEFNLFRSAYVVDLENNKHVLIIDINGFLIYGTSIYNQISSINKKQPILIVRLDKVQNDGVNSCNGNCDKITMLKAYRLAKIHQQPAIISLYYNFTNHTKFGPLESNDLHYDINTLEWDGKINTFSILANKNKYKFYLQSIENNDWKVDFVKVL